MWFFAYPVCAEDVTRDLEKGASDSTSENSMQSFHRELSEKLSSISQDPAHSEARNYEFKTTSVEREKTRLRRRQEREARIKAENHQAQLLASRARDLEKERLLERNEEGSQDSPTQCTGTNSCSGANSPPSGDSGSDISPSQDLGLMRVESSVHASFRDLPAPIAQAVFQEEHDNLKVLQLHIDVPLHSYSL